MENLILAYLGDAVFELEVRNYLIQTGIKNVRDLQQKSLDYVTAKSQRIILEKLLNQNLLTDNEISIIKKGRNTSSHKSKNNDIITYHISTGFECLIGYLYLNNPKRLKELMEEVLCE